MNEANAIEKDVMNYVNMIIGVDAKNLGPNRIWTYQDPQSKKLISIKIDESYINSVEDRLGLKAKNKNKASVQQLPKYTVRK